MINNAACIYIVYYIAGVNNDYCVYMHVCIYEKDWIGEPSLVLKIITGKTKDIKYILKNYGNLECTSTCVKWHLRVEYQSREY